MSERSPDTRDAYDAHGTAFMQLRGPALQPLEEQLASDVLRMAREHQPAADEPLRVIDVGLGYGKFLAWWQKQTNVLVLGGDNSRQMLRLAAQRNGGDHNQLQQFDAASLPFVDESVNVVFAHAIYHHVDHPVEAFRDARRVLKPGGIFYVFVRQGDFRGRRQEGVGSMYYRYYEMSELKRLLQDAGFQVIRIEPVKDPYPDRGINFMAAFATRPETPGGEPARDVSRRGEARWSGPQHRQGS